MMSELFVTDTPEPGQRNALLSLLQSYNLQHAGPAMVMPLAILLRGEAGEVIGGLHATSAYEWLIVELVFVPEELRHGGIGSALLAKAEEVARARGCAGIWLDTFSFQARGFYEQLGYEVFGEVPGHPAGGARYFLKKALT